MSARNKNDAVELNHITFSEGGCWKGRSTLQKCLIVSLVIFIIIAIAFFIAFLVIVTRKDSDSSNDGSACTTHNCLQTAAYLSNSIDDTANPCENFYQFACGKWTKSHPIPSTKNKMDSFGIADDKNKEIMRAALMKTDANVISGIAKLRTFFRSCINTDTIDALGADPLETLLSSGGANVFPTLNPAWTDEGWSFSQIAERIGNVGNLQDVPGFFIQITFDKRNSSRITVEVDQPTLTLFVPALYTGDRNAPFLQFYEGIYSQILIMLGANQTTAAQDAAAVVDFEVELAKIIVPAEVKADIPAFYSKMTVKNMTERYPQFDWLGYFNRFLANGGVTFTPETEIINMAVDYYDKFFDLVAKTSTRTLLNYGMWRLAYKYASQSSSAIRGAKQPIINALLGITETPARWQTCLDEMLQYFPEFMGRVFVDGSGFTAQTKQRALDMITNLKTTFREVLEETDWMTEATRTAALDKLAVMDYKVGYPEYIMNDTWISEHAAALNVTEGKYFENTMNILIYDRVETIKLMKRPVDRNRWLISPAMMNAVYSPQSNEMILPASILQTPFFDDTFPDVLNFAAIGSVVGHEITHGYDTTGRGFDKFGNLANWWQTEDLQRFTDKGQCMIDQYGAYPDPVLNMTVNGRLTLSENIADNAGLKEAYRAYRSYIAKRGMEEPKLPVLKYTVDQLFFIGYAQVWCSNYQDSYRKLLLQSDNHSPHYYRVIGTMRNSEDFARVFSCLKGGAMNPDKKCSVW